MASSLPVVRQLAWLAFLPQVVIIGGLIVGAGALGLQEPHLWGAGVYVLLAIVLRRVLSKHHRLGIRAFRRERFAEAVVHFASSYAYFTLHPWIDRYRFVTLLSASRMSYREMALLNMAFCQAQAGHREAAIVTYKRVLEHFPGSRMAQTSLRLMEPPAPALPTDERVTLSGVETQPR